jgi:HSP20 family protein
MARKKQVRKSSSQNSRAAETPESMTDLGSRLATAPVALVKRFGEEINKLFEDFGLDRGWVTPGVERFAGPGLWTPQVEMFERNNELIVRADLPGLERDDVTVEVAEDGLTIEGERRDEKEEKGEGFYRSERAYGKFYRRLPLPEGVKAEDANATFSNGVLEITIPTRKRIEQKTRRIEIHSESKPQARKHAA